MKSVGAGARLTAMATAAIVIAALHAPTVGNAQEFGTLHSEADPVRLHALATALQAGLPYVPGELLVRFRTGINATQQFSALSVLREPQQTASRWIGNTLLLKGLVNQDAEDAAALLRQQPEISYAQPNYIRRWHSVPNDPDYQLQWNFDQVNMPRAWDVSRAAGRGVTVAVLDTGMTTFDQTLTFRLPVSPLGLSFATFAVPFQRPPDFDFTRIVRGAEFTPTGPWEDQSGQRILFASNLHGTHVAGTIAEQTNNAFGLAGIANGATIMPVKVCFDFVDLMMSWGDTGIFAGTEGGCVTSDEIAGLHYAVDNGAKVLNISLGGIQASPAEQDALAYAVSKGVFVSISAGNDGLDGSPPSYPAAYAKDLDGVVAVAATTRTRSLALYSTSGPYVEVAAPGGAGDINGCSGSDREVIWQIAPNEADLQALPPRFDRYEKVGICGTSMASPHVAGAAALLYAQGVTNPAAIEKALEHFAVDLGPKGRDNQFGFGLIDVRSTLVGFGFGR